MSSYVELFGLPGSGKSTLVNSLGRRLGRHPERIVARPARGGLEALIASKRLILTEKPAVGDYRNIARRLLLDSMHVETQIEYPTIYARIFEIFSNSKIDSRLVRESLHYWKIRLAEHRATVANQEQSTVVTDEGLSQAVFSTLMRLPEGYRNRVLTEGPAQLLIGALPSARTTIWLDTPLEISLSRCRSGKGKVPPYASKPARDCLQKIAEMTSLGGGRFLRLDGEPDVARIERSIRELL